VTLSRRVEFVTHQLYLLEPNICLFFLRRDGSGSTSRSPRQNNGFRQFSRDFAIYIALVFQAYQAVHFARLYDMQDTHAYDTIS